MQINDRVFYTQNGPSDTGTIIEIAEVGAQPIRVEWDRHMESEPAADWYAEYQLTLIRPE